MVNAPSGAPLAPGTYDDTNAEWVYTGNWTALTTTGPYNDTLHFSTTINDSASLSFQGNQFKLTYTGYFNRGNLDVYVDNLKVGTINQYRPTLTWQLTWISPIFTDGTHTLKFVHASGPYAGIDAIQILQTTPLGSGTYDDTDSAWYYIGNWTAFTTSGPYNDTLHFSTTLNDSTSLVFDGPQFKLTYTGNSNRGNMTVFVDDVYLATINQYSPTLTWQQTWTSPVFSNGTHTLKLVHASGTYTGIDAIQILQTVPLEPGTYDDTDSAWFYGGNWTAATTSGPYNSTLHYSAAINNSASLLFNGTHFKLIYTSNSNRGNVTVFVDNVNVGTINQYSPTLTWQQTWTSPVFTAGTHVLKFVHASGIYAGIDAIEILSPLSLGTYDDTHSDWFYSGNWTAATTSGPYNGTLHYSTATNDYAMLSFEGYQFQLTYTSNFNRGNVTVFVDDVNVGTINQYSPSLSWQQTWTSPVFTEEIHTLKFVHATGAYAGIDAIEIIGTPDITPPAAIDDLQAVTGTANGSVELSWTAVGDDGNTGTASSYEIRYSINTITDANWDTAALITTGIPAPKASGQPQSMTVYGLTSGTYYFAVRAKDEVPNTGDVSNSPSAEAFTPPPPPNDDFNNATVISSMPYTDTTDYFYAATTEASDPQIVQCNSDEGKYSIWYAYTPASDGILSIDTFGTNLEYDTVMAVWTYDGSAFTPVACNDQAKSGTFLSEALAYLYKNTTYYIEVVQFSQPPQGTSNAPNPLQAPAVDEVVLNASFSPASLKSPGKYDDTDPGWIYSGDWFSQTITGPYNSTLHYSTTIDDYAALAFEGDQFVLTYTGYPNRGELDVYVDNIKVGTINQYNSSLAWQQTWTSSGLNDGVHILKLVHLSGSVVDIDAIQIFQPTPILGSGIYDDTDPAWTYTGSWTALTTSGPYNNTLHYSTTFNDSASLRFEGLSFILTYTGNSNRGNVYVYVDDIYVATINQYRPTLTWQLTWTSPIFTDGTHTLRLVHASGTYVGIDAIQIIQPTPLGPGTYDDTDSAWLYRGNWTALTTTGPLNGTLHYSTNINDVAVLAFQGSQFKLTYTGNSNRGNVYVYVDDIYVATINQYRPTLTWQLTWTSPIFTDGTHILKLVHASGTFVGIDAIQVIQVPPVGTGTYDDTNSAWYYSGTWTALTTTGPLNGTLHYSSTINDSATLVFTGTRFTLTFTGNVNRGNVTVFVDDIYVATINQYSSALTWQQTWNSPTFSSGSHVVKFVHATGTYAGIDAIQIIP